MNLFTPGHRACAGCGGAIVINQVMRVSGKNTIVALPTGCMEVVSTIYPFSAWNVPYIHVAFENVAAVISGVESAYKVLKRKGKIRKKWNFIAIGGDGGTYDIGLQALSGAIERRHNFLYVCYDNQAYMNTGIQRSSATPKGAHTTTSPRGECIPGKLQFRKNLTEIIASHDPVYVAQASPSHWKDLLRKIEKGITLEGPAFLNVLAPCPLGWGYHPRDTIKIARIAVNCKFWVLYEVENGKYKINYTPKKHTSIEEWLTLQSRFKHLFEEKNRYVIKELEDEVNRRWEYLVSRTKLK
jgi:pyruvate ferredoxin oxidoreductase beta subunit